MRGIVKESNREIEISRVRERWKNKGIEDESKERRIMIYIKRESSPKRSPCFSIHRIFISNQISLIKRR